MIQNKLSIFIIVIGMLNSCIENPSSPFTKENVFYLNDTISSEIDLRNDTVVIYFISSFKKDTVQIFVNDRFYSKDIISTINQIGTARLVVLGSVKDVKKVRIKFNENKIVTIKCDHTNQLFLVTRIQKGPLIVRAVRSFPSFD